MSTVTAADLDTTIATLLRMAEQWDECSMEPEMKTALRAAELLMQVREERDEGEE